MRFNSVFSKTYGDEPAQDKGGVKSGDRSGKVEPTSHSPTVNIQNSPAVRHRDRVTLNGGNTPGEIVLSRDQASYGSKAAPSPPATGAADEPRGMGGQFYDHSPTLQDLNAAKEKVSEWWHDPSAIGRDAQAAAEWAKSVPGDLKRAGEQAWQWATWDHVKEAPGQVWGWGKDQAQKGWAHGKDVYRKDGVGGLATAGLALGVEVFNPVEKLKMLELGTKVLKEGGALERAAHGAEHALEHAKSGDGGVRITEKKKRKRNPCHHLAKGNPNGKGPFRGGLMAEFLGRKSLVLSHIISRRDRRILQPFQIELVVSMRCHRSRWIETITSRQVATARMVKVRQITESHKEIYWVMEGIATLLQIIIETLEMLPECLAIKTSTMKRCARPHRTGVA